MEFYAGLFEKRVIGEVCRNSERSGASVAQGELIGLSWAVVVSRW